MRTLRTVFALFVAIIATNTLLLGQGMEKYAGGARFNLMKTNRTTFASSLGRKFGRAINK